ncbi:class I SAM-dependent methyltransferase [Chitinophaga arvensicola]|uniref:Methyltransferase domain-containing protein n=1 Tax=Chitinophaga arvensicola TaxID=29529 RepID=A0A1I0S8I4_9BACT|nr:class I SAM-dependent methyltransferase [Chitinophaga arvensicola]SEW52410.1 Methyltransferase domain-containing protein [Chitinophaga arvensicola]
MADRQNVEAYYDEHITGKLTGFYDGNPRAEMGWKTLTSNLLSAPQTILEIGCGIGDFCYKMHTCWPEAMVTGLDISPKSIEVANKLFSNNHLKFVTGILDEKVFAGQKFDLIVLMDVYEHISNEIRPSFDKVLADLLSGQGAILLTFPTPRHLDYLKKNVPEEIQPVDEDINVHTISSLANTTATDVILYQEMEIWSRGDYAHAFLRKPEKDWKAVPTPPTGAKRIARALKKLVRNNNLLSTRKNRVNFVKKKLGKN